MPRQYGSLRGSSRSRAARVVMGLSTVVRGMVGPEVGRKVGSIHRYPDLFKGGLQTKFVRYVNVLQCPSASTIV